MPSLSVNDVDLHYEVKGNGPPLLLIAGFASDGQSWAPVTRTLSERFTLIIPDNRGCGQTALNGAEVTIEAMTADCRALLDRLSIERVDILGHSMGGVIAASLAAQQPDRTRKLILAASLPSTPARAISVIETLVAMREVDPDETIWLKSFLHWLLTPRFFEHTRAVEAAIAMVRAYPHAQSLDDMRRQAEAIRRFSAPPAPETITAPTLLISGVDDIMTPARDIAAAFSALPSHEHKTMAWAGHSLHWDEPEVFAEIVIAFLEKP